jgi:uncharacterized protein YgfB (UPF0149 family)
MMQPDYTRIEQVLAHQHSLTDAAEAHGTLAGCLCGVSGYRFEDWLREILPEGRAGSSAASALRELYDATAAALIQPDMEFEPLLPGDEAPLAERTQALAEWCQGFLYGLGAGRIQDPGQLPGEVGEIVRDFIEISHAGVEEDATEEANESAYAELVEFVRVGVQLLFEELGVARAPAAPTAAPLH